MTPQISLDVRDVPASPKRAWALPTSDHRFPLTRCHQVWTRMVSDWCPHLAPNWCPSQCISPLYIIYLIHTLHLIITFPILLPSYYLRSFSSRSLHRPQAPKRMSRKPGAVQVHRIAVVPAPRQHRHVLRQVLGRPTADRPRGRRGASRRSGGRRKPKPGFGVFPFFLRNMSSLWNSN